jgi:hypothetical protein
MSLVGLTDTFFHPQECLSCGFWHPEAEMDGPDWLLSQTELETALARGSAFRDVFYGSPGAKEGCWTASGDAS